MASVISVTLKMIDQMSQKMEEIANGGDRAAQTFEQFGTRANDAMERFSSSSQKASDSMQSASSASAEYAEQGSRAQQAFEEQANAADKAAQEVEEFGQETEDAGRKSEEFGEKASKSITDLGDVLAAAGIALALKEIAAAYFECDDAADSFETAMAKVGTIADTSAVSLDTIQGDIQKLSNETGVAVNDLAEAAYSAISASVDTADAVTFVGQANALAVGGFTQSATAVDVLTTAINAYGLSADQATAISDRLINTQNLGKTTVDELAQSLGTVIPTAAAFGVNLDNLSSAYVTLTRNGINTANATTMLNGMLSELGDSGSDVADVLSQKTGKSFAQLMEEGYNLGDVIQILGDYVEGDSTAFLNLWSNIRAGRGAINIFNAGADEFAAVMDSMAHSTGAANEAFKKMTDTGDYVQQKWDNAIDNFKIAIGNMQPSLDGLMSAGTEILNKVTEFVEKNPQLMAQITTIGAVLVTFTAGVIAYSAAAKMAAVATGVFNTALTTLMANPVALAVVGIAALAAGIYVAVQSMEDMEYQNTRLTASSQKLSDEIDKQESLVVSLEEQYGSNNEKTLEAKAKLGELKAEFEATRQTIGEFKRQIADTAEAVAESTSKYDEASAALENQGETAQILVAELQRLQSQSELTAFQQEYEKQVIDELNGLYPSLGLAYDETTGKLNKSTASLKEYCEQKKTQLKIEQDAATYLEYMNEMAEYTAEMETAQANLTQATDEYNQKLTELNGTMTTVGGNDIASQSITNAKNAMDDAQGTVDDLTEKMDDLQSKMDALEGSANSAADGMGQIGAAADGLIDSSEELQSAMEAVFTMVEEDAKDLAAAYDEAREKAAEAANSGFALFETIDLGAQNATVSLDEMMKAFESQKEYLENYVENLEKAKEFGLDSKIIEGLSDGSQESAAQLASIVSELEKLESSGQSAKDKVEELNAAFEDVQGAKKTLEDTLVEMNESLATQTQAMVEKMEKAVEDMNMDSKAAAAAKATIEAYINQIKTLGNQAVSEANSIAQRVAAALSAAKVSMGSAAGHANGTTYGEDVYIAGENGPELIVGRRGSEVFPATETAKILSAVMNNRRESENLAPPPSEIIYRTEHNENKSSTTNELQTLTININGKGNIQTNGGGITMQRVGEYVSSNLEKWILDIASKEMYEEAEVAYEF